MVDEGRGGGGGSSVRKGNGVEREGNMLTVKTEKRGECGEGEEEKKGEEERMMVVVRGKDVEEEEEEEDGRGRAETAGGGVEKMEMTSPTTTQIPTGQKREEDAATHRGKREEDGRSTGNLRELVAKDNVENAEK